MVFPQIADNEGVDITHLWIAMYRKRERVFGHRCEPQWRMLVDLRANGPCSVTSLSIASGAKLTTALRHIGVLQDDGLIVRSGAEDRRKGILSLTDKARALFQSLDHTGRNDAECLAAPGASDVSDNLHDEGITR